MKIRCDLLLLITLFVVVPAHAQIDIGVLGRLNIADLEISPNPEEDLSSRKSWGFGAVMDYRFSDYLSLRVEPMYLQKGCNATQVEEGIETAIEVKLHLELPVMLKYGFYTGSASPYILVGPLVSYNVSSKVRAAALGFSQETDTKDETTNFDFGVGFGAGMNFPAGWSSIFLEARYTIGLKNINTDPADPDSEVKSKGVQILAGVTFPLSRHNRL